MLTDIENSTLKETSCLANENYQIPKYLFLLDCSKKAESYFLIFQCARKRFTLSLKSSAFQIFSQFVQPQSPLKVSQNLQIPLSEVLDVIKDLHKSQVLIPSYQSLEFERYSRHLHYYSMNSLDPIKSQKALKSKTVSFIGAGGIGNWLGLNLIGLGLKKIRLIDPDVIETTNLTRQILFSESDVGKTKVSVAKRELEKRNSETEVEAIPLQVSEENLAELIEGSDFAFLSADFPPFQIQKWTNRACIAKNIPFSNVGYSGGLGICGPLIVSGETGCLECFNNHQVNKREFCKEADPIKSHYQTPSFVNLNSMISSVAAFEMIKFFLGFGDIPSLGHQLQLDPLTFQFRKRAFPKDPSCAFCQES